MYRTFIKRDDIVETFFGMQSFVQLIDCIENTLIKHSIDRGDYDGMFMETHDGIMMIYDDDDFERRFISAKRMTLADSDVVEVSEYGS